MAWERQKSTAGERPGIYSPKNICDNTTQPGVKSGGGLQGANLRQGRVPDIERDVSQQLPKSRDKSRRSIVMKTNVLRSLLVLGMVLTATLLPFQANAAQCSTASTAGNWAYTYSGTIFTANGPLPAASVGHFHQDLSGNITGSQTRSVAGQSGLEDISGKVSVNPNCTASATIEVFVGGVLQRTTTLALVYDSNGSHVRMIFQSVTLPDGTNVPVVITIDGNRLFSKD